MSIGLQQIVVHFAEALATIDATAFNHKYNAPGIGSFDEPEIVQQVANELQRRHPEAYSDSGLEVVYPNTVERCDLCFGVPPNWQWALEIKSVRFLRSNGDLEDTTIKRLLSPYDDDGSALSDCRKLAAFPLGVRKAVLLYGFDYPGRGKKPPRFLDPAITAFEILTRSTVSLGPQYVAQFAGLRHPWHQQGRVFAWELLPVQAEG
jgi:hypothetical protein